MGLEINFSNWFLVAWVVPFAVAHFSLGVNFLFPGIEWAEKFKEMTSYEILRMEVFSLLAGATINLLFAFGEEIGWRGLLYRELRDKGFWLFSLLTGLLWGIWHVPIILRGHNYPDHPQVGAIFYLYLCVF